MAIALDQLLGTNQQDTTSGSIALTTTNAVSAGGFIVLGLALFETATTVTAVNGGGLSWSIDIQGHPGSSPGQPNHTAIISAQAPSGLAASTVITATISPVAGARTLGGASFTGVATSSPLEDTAAPSNGSATSWATNSMDASAGSLVCGIVFVTSTGAGLAPTAPALEAWEDNDAGNAYGVQFVYRIVESGGAYTVGGTMATSTYAATGATYLAAAAGAAKQTGFFARRRTVGRR